MEKLQELFSGIENCDIEKILQLARSGIIVNSWDSTGLTPLLFTIMKFGEKISSISLEENSNEIQKTALADIAKNVTSIISILLENGAIVNYEKSDGGTALGVLKYYWYLGMLSFLPSVIDGNIGERKDVVKSVSKIFDDIASILIGAGADEDRKNKFGETPSEYADRIITGEVEKSLNSK